MEENKKKKNTRTSPIKFNKCNIKLLDIYFLLKILLKEQQQKEINNVSRKASPPFCQVWAQPDTAALDMTSAKKSKYNLQIKTQ